MNLGQMRLEVRRAVAEQTADLWSDSEINDWLNEGAKIMVSQSQAVQSMYQFTTMLGQQEYLLPDDVDEIFNVTYFDSALYPLIPVDARQVQQGTSYTGSPRYFYTRAYAKATAQQSSTGVTIADANSQNPMATGLVLGVYPAPNAAKQVTVFYYSRHYEMRVDSNVPAVPPEFRRGIIAYATSLAKEKECAYAEADRKRQEFKEFTDQLAAKLISEGQEIAFPTVRTEEDQSPAWYGDVVIKLGRAT